MTALRSPERRWALCGVGVPAGVAALLLAVPSVAGEADVEAVEVTPEEGGMYRFAVTVRHADEGREHFADRWEVVSEDGDVLGTRVLHHPHVDEQPFTRGQGGIAVPEDAAHVIVKAHDKLHGFGGREMRVKLPDR